MEHTKEPWRVSDKSKRVVCYGHDEVVINSEANARRIVACINAMAGIDNDNVLFRRGSIGTVRKHIVTQQVQIEKLTAQRDELQSQLATERASLFAESQRKQQLEQQVAELLTSLGAASNYIDHLGGLSNGYRIVIQKVRGGE